MAVFTSRRGGGGLARRLVLTVIGVSFLLGWLTLVGQRAGVYDPEAGVAMSGAAYVSIFASLLWWQARVLSRADADRRRAEEALADRARLAALEADVAVALTQSDSLQGLLQRCAEAMVRHLDAAFARIWTLNAAQQM